MPTAMNEIGTIAQTAAQRLVDILQPATPNTGEMKNRLDQLCKMLKEGKIKTIEPILPLLLTLKGKPYTLKDHFMMEPLFRTDIPPNLVCMQARQSAKSSSITAQSVVMANTISHFNILFVTPLYEQVRRLSNNYVRGFIEESPIKDMFYDSTTENSVLQRSLKNHSKLIFSFALLDADRIRGLSCDKVNFDEVQDMDPDHIPIIREVMSHSDYGITWYTGTPKTEDNIMEGLWRRSSQAEWFIPCQHCKHWNIPSKEYDIIDMIGPLRDDISDDNPAVICARCTKPINPRHGRWVHRYPDKANEFPGLHVPQMLLPIHYAHRRKWAEFLGKFHGQGNMTKAMFYNECLGESYDEATKLVTISDIRKAAVLPLVNRPNDFTEALKLSGNYQYKCLSVDWGGGGNKETSFTTLAVLGWHPTGKIDVIWGKRSLSPHDHIAEAEECLRVFNTFKCHFFVHDFSGAGSLRETFINQAGIPSKVIIPISYVGTGKKDIMTIHPATRQSPRDYYLLHKTRSLQLTCNCIKLGHIRFFQYDYETDDNPGLLHDFLALVENKVPTARAGDLYTIVRNPMFKDDFAHSVNMGCCALWHATQNWPNLAALVQITEAQLRAATSPEDKTWRKKKDK